MPGLFQVSVKGIYIKDTQALVLSGCIPSGECFWDLPGGRVESNEDPKEALLREVSEELPTMTNVRVEQLLQANVSWHKEDQCELIILYYRITGELLTVELTSEHTGYHWLRSNELPHFVETTQQAFVDTGADIALRAALE